MRKQDWWWGGERLLKHRVSFSVMSVGNGCTKIKAPAVFSMYSQLLHVFVAAVNKTRIILFRKLSFLGTMLRGSSIPPYKD